MTTTPDPTMELISAAVLRGRESDAGSARRELLAIWQRTGVSGDPFYRCTLAHYLADLHEDPAEALIWDVRALDAADALTDERARQHHASLAVAGFYSSLHVNLADDLRRLGAFRAAAEQIELAEQHAPALPDGPYGDTIRTAVSEIGRAVAERDTARRASAPGSGQQRWARPQ